LYTPPLHTGNISTICTHSFFTDTICMDSIYTDAICTDSICTDSIRTDSCLASITNRKMARQWSMQMELVQMVSLRVVLVRKQVDADGFGADSVGVRKESVQTVSVRKESVQAATMQTVSVQKESVQAASVQKAVSPEQGMRSLVVQLLQESIRGNQNGGNKSSTIDDA
jgi:hypothetical protein